MPETNRLQLEELTFGWALFNLVSEYFHPRDDDGPYFSERYYAAYRMLQAFEQARMDWQEMSPQEKHDILKLADSLDMRSKTLGK